jgi:hypothetical protein
VLGVIVNFDALIDIASLNTISGRISYSFILIVGDPKEAFIRLVLYFFYRSVESRFLVILIRPGTALGYITHP